MIPFIDLEAQQKRIRQRINENLARLLDHGQYIMGPEVAELEEKLCEFCGAAHCITCASGTDALLMALMAWNIGPGEAIFLPAFTFFATAEMPQLLRASPVFVDIEPETFNICPKSLQRQVEHIRKEDRLKPRAVITVDLFGQPAKYAELLPIAREQGLLTLEDAAQAFGAAQNGARACNLGCDCAATSFFPAKPLGCYGDGGAIFTQDESVARELRSIRVHGKGKDKYDNVRVGINGRLDTMQAAILLAKLEIFPDELELRNRVAHMYGEALKDVPGVRCPGIAPGNFSSWAQYSILVPEARRDSLRKALHEKGIPTNIYYPMPLPMLRAFEDAAQNPDDFKVSLQVSRQILSLPFHPYLSEDVISFIADGIRSFLA